MSPLTPPTDVSALIGFRAGLHSCLTGWADATFEVCEALLCTPGPVRSVPALSLESVFGRSHGSLYAGLKGTRVDTAALRALLVAHRPPDWPNIYAVDASAWARSNAECSPERGFYYSPSQHSSGQPIVAGWSYSWIAQLGWAPDSWTAPVDVARIPPRADVTTTTASQIQELVTALQSAPGTNTGPTPLLVFDAGTTRPDSPTT